MFDHPYPVAPLGCASLSRWLAQVVRVFAAHWKRWLLLGIVANLLLTLAAVPLAIMFPPGFVDHLGDSEFLLILPVGYGLLAFVLAVFALIYPGLVAAALRQLLGEEPVLADLFEGRLYYYSSLGVLVLSLFWSALGLFGCGIGAVVVLLLLFLAYPVLVAQNVRPTRALAQSWSAVGQNVWFYALFFATVYLAILAVQLLMHFLPLAAIHPYAKYAGAFIGRLAFILIPIAQAVAYLNTFEADIANQDSQQCDAAPDDISVP